MVSQLGLLDFAQKSTQLGVNSVFYLWWYLEYTKEKGKGKVNQLDLRFVCESYIELLIYLPYRFLYFSIKNGILMGGKLGEK